MISFSLKGEEILYADIFNLTDKEEFINSISRCLNVLSNDEYYNNPKHISKSEQVLKLIPSLFYLKNDQH